MDSLNNEMEIHKLIESSDIALLYFSGTTCGACEAIRGKIEKILESYPKIHSGFINGEEHVELMGSFQIFTVPQVILYVFGKETLREGKHLDLLEFERKIHRYCELLENMV